MCPKGQDCGIEETHGQEVTVGYVKTLDDQSSSSNTGVIVAIVISLIVIASIIGCIIIVYYRCVSIFDDEMFSQVAI